MTASINGTTGITFNDASIQNTAATGFGFKNRMINGAMVIDQRNAGASISVSSSGYPVDRMKCWADGGGVFTAQQSTTVPSTTTFTNSSVLTVTTPDSSLAANDFYGITQYIEGYNVADFGFGTAVASPITLSFWVQSSVTGTYSVAFGNSDGATRSYIATYTITAANTWENKTITIPGDTTGTWLKTTATGLRVWFALGMGSTYITASPNAWIASAAIQSSSSVNWISTTGATFYITGVQLEKGSTATSFDYRPYGTELMLCQRYFANLLAAGTDYNIGVTRDSTTATQFVLYAPVTMRATPTLGVPSGYGRIVAYDTSFGITVNAVTSMVLLFTADNRILNIFTGTASYGGQYVYSAYDTIGATTAMTLSSEL